MTNFITNKPNSNIEQILSEGKSVQFPPTGYSMYPMFIPGRDEAIVSPLTKRDLRRGDVVLYRRDESILVLHRICRINKQGLYMVGDNQFEVEGPLRPDQVKGILTAFIRNKKTVSVRNPIYLISAHIWLFMLPIRRPIQLIISNLKQLKKR